MRTERGREGGAQARRRGKRRREGKGEEEEEEEEEEDGKEMDSKDIGEGVQEYETTLVIWTIVSKSPSQLDCESNVALVAQKNEV